MYLNSQSTFNEVFDLWQHEHRYIVKESSFNLYKTLIDVHLRPSFGTLKPSHLSEAAIDNFIACKKNQNLSDSYISLMLLLFQCILKTAQRKQHLSSDIIVPRFSRHTRNTPDIFSQQEWKTLDTFLRKQTDSFSFGLLICMYTGLRIGELSGLQWGDFDEATGQFTIQRTIYRMNNPDYTPESALPKTILQIGEPKTISSYRSVPLPAFLLQDIPWHRRSDQYFVISGSSQCLEPRCIQRKYKKVLEQCGIRYRNFHSLRHSFATIGIQKGFDYKTLSEILGHSSVNVTLNIYVHSNVERKRQCIELLTID